MRHMSRQLLVVAILGIALNPAPADSQRVDEKVVLDNAQVMVAEYTFPPGFKGEEHVVPVNEFAYVLDGEFSVVTRGKGKSVVHQGEVEFAPRGAIHYSLNESRRPARVLVVLLKER